MLECSFKLIGRYPMCLQDGITRYARYTFTGFDIRIGYQQVDKHLDEDTVRDRPIIVRPASHDRTHEDRRQQYERKEPAQGAASAT